MSSKPALYIMCGLPFSVKTYVSKLISEQLQCQRISYDELWVDKKAATGLSVPYDTLIVEARHALTTLLTSGQSVVFDSLNDTAGVRNVLRDLSREAGAKSVVVYMNISDDTLRKRHRRNHHTKERHDVPNIKMTEVHTRFEPPINESCVVEYRPDVNCGELIGQLRQYERGWACSDNKSGTF